MPSAAAAAAVFLSTLDGLHPSLTFPMELPVNNKIPFNLSALKLSRTASLQKTNKHWVALTLPKSHRKTL